MKSKAVMNTWELLFVQSYENKDQGGHRTHGGNSHVTLEPKQLRALFRWCFLQGKLRYFTAGDKLPLLMFRM
jgi:hypothetical protein